MSKIAQMGSIIGLLCAFTAPVRGEERTPRESKEPAEPNYLRASLELSLALGAGTAWYWIDRDRQVADWDFPSWRSRLTTEVLRYDNNPFRVNFAWHAMNGMSFHWIARSNEIEFWRAIGLGFVTSAAWEYLLEYRENVSVNDLIFTTGAGIPLGEFFYLLGRYVTEDSDAAQWRSLRWTFGFPQSLHRAMDGNPGPGVSETQLWHRFSMGYELATGIVQRLDRKVEDEQHLLHTLNLKGALVNLPDYLRPVSVSRFFGRGNVTSFSLDVSMSTAGTGVNAISDAFLAGWHHQRPQPGGTLVASTVGLVLGYHYRRQEFGGFKDRLGIFHFPGPGGNLHVVTGDFALDAKVRLHGDFAGVHAMSNAEWNAAHPDAVGKTILRTQSYYYGWGASGHFDLSVRWRGLSLGGAFAAGWYNSDEGMDRFQDEVTDDTRATDAVLDTTLWLQWDKLPWEGYMGVRFSRQARDATLGEFTADQSLSRIALHGGIRF